MPKHPTKLWLIVDFEGHIVHQSTDLSHVDLMRRYVRKSREAGDDWTLLKYSFDEVVSCDELDKAAS